MDVSHPNYYAVIPSSVRYDDRLETSARLLYGEIAALIGSDGYCFISNAFITENYAYVVGTLSDSTEFIETVGSVTASERREIWMDTSIHQETDETEAECRARARAYATMDLGKRIRRTSFSVTIDPEELGRLYTLGDIVSCVSVRFGVSFNARIEGIKYTIDNKKAKTEAILGDPILTALGELKLNARN